MPNDRLLKQQEAFVIAYLGGKKGENGFRPFHGTKSAIEAGYSPRTAASQASTLLKHPKVAARIREEFTVRAIPAGAVLSELGDIAMAEWKDFLIVTDWDEDGNPAKFKMDMNAKVKSLELLGKHHKLFVENVEVGAAESFIQALRDFGKGDDGASGGT